MRIRRALVTFVGVTSLLLVTQTAESSAAARCDHGQGGRIDSFSHSHGGGATKWYYHGHDRVDGNHLHLMHDHVNRTYDWANYCPS